MRYHVLATDYDGTLAEEGKVDETTFRKLQQLKASGRKLLLVTGRELDDLQKTFPGYPVFDYIVAENGALVYDTAAGKEELLGQPPDALFIEALRNKGVQPLSTGKVIVATREPYENVVLDVIKTSGIERQVIFNKGAVMILPPGINKATGLRALLQSLNLSVHNVVAVGDAENDSAMFQVAECAVAVNNALPSLKETVDMVTAFNSSAGVTALIDALLRSDLQELDQRLTRHYLELGSLPGNRPFTISPYRSGILLSGVSGGGKTTMTISIAESLIKSGYQFCLIDPEGDYLELPGAVVMGNETAVPAISEIKELLKDPGQHLVICTVSIPLADRPAFFSQLLSVLLALRKEYGHPHWILLDEAHHLVPAVAGITADRLPADFNNFIVVSTAPHVLSKAIVSKVGMVITVGDNPAYPIEQFCSMRQLPLPPHIPSLQKTEACIWDVENNQAPYVARFNLPHQLLQRHKKKYAQGDMDYNSFFFTGRENKLRLQANNLMLFTHIAEGIDADTWLYHLKRKDFTRWFSDSIHDRELAQVSEEAEQMTDVAQSKKHILDFITKKYIG